MPRTENTRLGGNMIETMNGDEMRGGEYTTRPIEDPDLNTSHTGDHAETDGGSSTTRPVESTDDNTSHTGDHAEASPVVDTPHTPSTHITVSDVVKGSDFYIYRLVKKFGKTFLKNVPAGKQTKIGEGMDVAVEGGKIIGKVKDTPRPPIVPPQPDEPLPSIDEDVYIPSIVQKNEIEVTFLSPSIAMARINNLSFGIGGQNRLGIAVKYGDNSDSRYKVCPKVANDATGHSIYLINRQYAEVTGPDFDTEDLTISDIFAYRENNVVNKDDINSSDRVESIKVKYAYGDNHNEYGVSSDINSIWRNAYQGTHATSNVFSVDYSLNTRLISNQDYLATMSAWEFIDSGIDYRSGSTTLGKYLIILYATRQGHAFAETGPAKLVFGKKSQPNELQAGRTIIGIKDFSKSTNPKAKDQFKWLAVPIYRGVSAMNNLNPKYFGAKISKFDHAEEEVRGKQLTLKSFSSEYTSGAVYSNNEIIDEMLNATAYSIIPKHHPSDPNMTILDEYIWTMPISEDGFAQTPPEFVEIYRPQVPYITNKPVPPTPKPVPPTPAPEKPKIYKMSVGGIDTSVSGHFALKMRVEDGVFKEGRKFVVTYSDGSEFTAGDHGSIVSKYPDSIDMFRVPQYKNGDGDQSIKVKYAKVVSTDPSDHTEYAWYTWE